MTGNRLTHGAVERLRSAHDAVRRADRELVESIGEVLHSGVLEEHGYSGRRKPDALVDLLGMERTTALRLIHAAEAVCARTDDERPRLPATAARFTAGEATPDQVRTVAGLLDSDAGKRLDADAWAIAESRLAALVPTCTLRQLRVEGARILAELGPEPSEQPAPPVNELRFTTLPNGGLKFVELINDPLDATLVRGMLETMSAPLTSEDARPAAQRHAAALVEVFGFAAKHGTDKDLPYNEGSQTLLAVTMTLTDLLDRHARGATLDNGATLDAGSARRACCGARVIPIVLGTESEILDTGRTYRTAPIGLRRAVIARDQACAHPGCDRPPNWCEVHHILEWSKGGPTSLSNSVLLCRHHHRLHHATEWQIHMADDGHPDFIPPAFIDPTQTPRRQPRPTPALQ